jgi:hypothetical protein
MVLALAVLVSFSCKSSGRYHKPKKAHNHYRKKSKNSWMEEKRRNMQQF